MMVDWLHDAVAFVFGVAGVLVGLALDRRSQRKAQREASRLSRRNEPDRRTGL
jgi:hypothetical protein